MHTITLTTAAALALTALSTAALAAPQIPTFANPYPDQPVATDGSPLPQHNVGVEQGWTALAVGQVVTGRSVAVSHAHRR